MTRRIALSWGLTATSTALMIGGSAAAIASARAEPDDATVLEVLALVGPSIAFSVVGGLISTRRPGNPIGWLLAAIGWLFALVVASSSITRWGLGTGDVSNGLAGWIDVGSNGWVIALGLIGTQLLPRLPDGRLPSRHWRWYSRVTVFLIVASTVGMTAQSGRVEGVRGTTNPLASETLAPLSNVFLFVILSFVVGIAALVLRYRRSNGHDRAQLRWVAFSGGVFVSMYIVGLALLATVDENSAIGVALTTLIASGFSAVPVGIGFAVLRQRLYDIDVVINRALVYGSLTATLAAMYLGSVLLLQLLLQKLTAGSGLAVAASTLATAALVRPARARIQGVVDRRFFRHKYDATQTLHAFGTRLRDEIDLDALTTELRTVVTQTMQPAHLSLWVRTPEDAR